MSTFDDFVHISTGTRGRGASASASAWPGAGSVPGDFFENTRGQRQCTEGLMVDSIRKYHPKYHVTITDGYLNFAGFAASRDDVIVSPHGDSAQSIIERQFIPPPRRYGDEGGGSFYERVVFGCFDYHFQGNDFILYSVTGSEGMFNNAYNYVLTPIDDDAADDSKLSAQKKADELISAASSWNQELHDEILVFDGGYWDKNKELWDNVQKAKWEDVILAKERKKAIIDDVVGFFDSQERYAEFEVPWKRGVIFYGPPGNGKTISTKALMHDVAKRVSPRVESLYVKTFNSYGGPEYGIRQIFLMARRMAPCLLIFEDIDSLVNPMVRSYFLNEVDGLESNHGILMIGSTNHLERLDPGIAKRPSRFDRKYFFDVPNKEERTQYAEYWRNKLRNNKKIDFPKLMSARVADITGDFSFAYMKEAFVAALLAIVAHGDDKSLSGRGGGDDLSNNILWKELKKQVENLRKEMESDNQAQPADVDTRSRRVTNEAETTQRETELPPPMGQRVPASGRENPWDGNSLSDIVSQLRQVEQRANDAFRPHPWRRQRGAGRPGDRNPSLFHEMGSRLDYLQACADLHMLDEPRDNSERPALPARNRPQGRREEARAARRGGLDGLPDLVPW